jgi:hypothetical protein
LCRQFEGQGLRFFKENKKETFVSRSRPRPLDAGVLVSLRVRAIVEFIRKHPLCTYKEVVVGLVPQGATLLERAAAAAASTTAPSAAEVAAPESAEASATEAAAPETETAEFAAPESVETTESAVESGAEIAEVAVAESVVAETPVPAAETETAAADRSALEGPSEADREGIALLQDLRWLIREGYVTEFANGQLRVVERQEKPIILQAPKRLRLFGRAFTLWTKPYLPGRPPRWLRLPARSFTLWTRAVLTAPVSENIESPAPEETPVVDITPAASEIIPAPPVETSAAPVETSAAPVEVTATPESDATADANN